MVKIERSFPLLLLWNQKQKKFPEVTNSQMLYPG